MEASINRCRSSNILIQQGYKVNVKIVGNDPSMSSRQSIANDLQCAIDKYSLNQVVSIEDWSIRLKAIINGLTSSSSCRTCLLKYCIA